MSRPHQLQGRAAVLLAAASVGLTLAAAGLVATNHDGVLAFVGWLLSLALVAGRWCRFARGPRLAGVDWIVLAALLAVSACFRLYRIAEIPAAPYGDEIADAANAVELAETRPFEPFASTPMFAAAPDWAHTTNLYLYAVYFPVRLSDYSVAGIKAVSLIPGIAAPLLLFLLGRRFLPRGWAALAAAFLAVSHWHVLMSRWGFQTIVLTAVVIPTFARLHDAATTRRAAPALEAGWLAGLALSTYLAARASTLGALAFFFILLASDRSRDRVVQLGAFVAGTLQVSLPLLVYWMLHPVAFSGRMGEVSLLGQLARGHLAPLLSNLSSYVSMFFVAGDPNARSNIPGTPMLAPLTAAFLVLGIAVATRHWRRAESTLSLLWLGSGLAVGVLSDTAMAPNTFRLTFASPACMLLAATGLRAATRGLARPLPRLAPLLGAGIAAAAIGLAAARTLVLLFVERPANRQCWTALEDGAVAGVLRAALEPALSSGSTALLDRSLEFPAVRTQFDVLTARRVPAGSIAWVDAAEVVPSRLRDAVLVVRADRAPALPLDLQDLPSIALRGPFGDSVAVAVSASRHAIDALSRRPAD